MAYSKSLTNSAPKEEELKELDEQISGTNPDSKKTKGSVNFKIVIIVALIAAVAVTGFYFYKKKKK